MALVEHLDQKFLSKQDLSVLAVDYGNKRVGLASYNRLQGVIFPLQTIANGNDIYMKIKTYALQFKSEVVVIGLPLHMNGEENAQTALVRDFANKLNDALDNMCAVYLQDERMSSIQADALLRMDGFDGRKRREMKDVTAAYLILEMFLRRAGIYTI
ncbi:Holliday junction resolvase [Rickettsiales endosymbiont of Paramecium tredecaurelia]|uniref:Holliday junction resolvase RuvX n=1 Tax=Candidatus Sarmatiella mevalonica TaxID=2770581 RepID=UPI0019251322|nr:Holliday junction resolvase RuvX [Candidatus Sarmatiella mevalonica]MBL3285172.1 Holliday junction resolvase [Candidatus Sarmatiella mevalonica]